MSPGKGSCALAQERDGVTVKRVILSLAQMDIAWGQPEANLAKAEQWVAEAGRRGSDLILFPELWTTAYDLDHAVDHAAELGQGMLATLGELARQNRIFLAGSILRRGSGRVYNSAVLYAPDGRTVETYDKVHLFGLMDEDRFLAPGTRTPVFDLPWGRGAMAICYDLRFPELFRKYALAGAEMIFLPAEWPHPRLEHWRTLLRARAIENQSFYVACNRVGRGGDAVFFGHSSIIDPRGEVVVEAGDSEQLITATIDLESVVAARNLLTVFKDRRPELY
jgi:omega-amidase